MKKIHYKIAGCIFFAIILTPIAFFVSYFNDNAISDQIERWGQFGDYFGGLLNPIISLASLVTLGYLTYLVNNLSSRDDKRLFLLQMKMKAYDELVTKISEMNLMIYDMRSTSAVRDKFSAVFNSPKAPELLMKSIEFYMNEVKLDIPDHVDPLRAVH